MKLSLTSFLPIISINLFFKLALNSHVDDSKISIVQEVVRLEKSKNSFVKILDEWDQKDGYST